MYGGKRPTSRRILVPPLARSRELVLQSHEADDLLNDLRPHTPSGHFVLRLIDGCLGC